MSAPPPWYETDDSCTETKVKITLVSHWTTHVFHVANPNGFYYFADPIGCDASGRIIVQHAIKHKLTQNRYFQTIYIEPEQDIQQQLLDALKHAILGLNPAYVSSLFCCEDCPTIDRHG